MCLICRDLEKYNIERLLDQDIDYEQAFAMTAELVAMEVVNRVFICVFEVR